MKFFIVCPRGLEVTLHTEITQIVHSFQDTQTLSSLGLGAEAIEKISNTFKSTVMGPVPVKPTGGIEVAGPLALAMAINLHSRIASRVLAQVTSATYRNEDDVYNTVKNLVWEDWFTSEQTLRVDVTSHRSPLTSLNFVTLKIKDAICDRLRELSGERPSIDTATPDVRVMAYLDETHVTVYMDTSGEALFKRGWRDEKGAAPLKENLAAGILALTGWTPEQPLFDPMCGSGTFMIEAAQIALRVPSGAIRAGLFDDVAAFNQEDLEDLDEDDSEDEEVEEDTPFVWKSPISQDTQKPIFDARAPAPVRKPVRDFSSRDFSSKGDRSPQNYAARKSGSFRPTRVDLVSSFQGFGFQRLKPFVQSKELAAWKLVISIAKATMEKYKNQPLKIAGSDINEKMIYICKSNWKKARLPGTPLVRQVDALVAKAPYPVTSEYPGVMLFNPPYGERLEIKGGRGDDKPGRGARDPLPKNISDPEFVEFLTQFGRHLKDDFGGWQVDVLTADMGLPGQLRMKESKRTPLFNGAIECRLFRFDIRAPRPVIAESVEPLKPIDPTEQSE